MVEERLMAEMGFFKLPHGVLVPADPETEQRIAKLKVGDVVRGDFKKMRNPANHRRFFALMSIAFEAWEPTGTVKDGDLPPNKSPEVMRKQLIILAGYYDQAWNLDGTLRLEAQSMSFGNLDELEFKELFSAVVQVVIDKILVNYTHDDVDRVVDEVIGF
jgi:hypothetical protein